MKTGGVNEFRAMVRTIVETSDKAGFLGAADIEGIADEWAQKIAAARDASVAAALDAQAEFYWEASTLLDPAKSVAEMQGEDAMGAILDAQIRTMREVSTRLRRRAAEWRGLPAEDQAIHEMAAGTSPPAQPTAAACTRGGPVSREVLEELGAAYLAQHPELDPKATSLEYRPGKEGWYVAGHIVIEQQPGFAMTPAPPLCDCACCAVGDGLCHCEGPKTKMCKCDPCKNARKDMK